MNRITRFAGVFAFAAAVAAPALAAPQTYMVEGTHTFPRFSYSHFGLSTQLAKFDRTTGTVILDKEAETAEVDITIDMTSVNTGYATFDEHIQEEDFLDTAQFPTATFKSTDVVFENGAPVSIEGELTIKGITQPVTLEVSHFVTMPHPMLDVDAIGADASTVIKRSDFNADKYAPHVGDDVTISIAIEAVQQQ